MRTPSTRLSQRSRPGSLPGGGSTLAYLLRFEDEICNAIEDEDEKRGAKIVFNSLSAPVCQIAKNCGIEGQIVLSKVIDKDFGYGFNAANFEYGDLFDAGVVDSAQVTLSALENSFDRGPGLDDGGADP